MGIVWICGIVMGLAFIATGEQHRLYYALYRVAMPVLAGAVFIDVLSRGVTGQWSAFVLLSGLVFVPVGDRLPRVIWLPINIGVMGLYSSYAGLVVWQQVIG